MCIQFFSITFGETFRSVQRGKEVVQLESQRVAPQDTLSVLQLLHPKNGQRYHLSPTLPQLETLPGNFCTLLYAGFFLVHITLSTFI